MELRIGHHRTPHKIEMRHDQLLGLEPELQILHEMVIDQDLPLRVIRVATWLVHRHLLAILYIKHKLYSPMCGDF